MIYPDAHCDAYFKFHCLQFSWAYPTLISLFRPYLMRRSFSNSWGKPIWISRERLIRKRYTHTKVRAFTGQIHLIYRRYFTSLVHAIYSECFWHISCISRKMTRNKTFPSLYKITSHYNMIKKDFSTTLLKGENVLIQIDKHIFAYIFSWAYIVLSILFTLWLFIFREYVESILGDGLFGWLVSLYILISITLWLFLLLSEVLDTLVVTDDRILSFERAFPFGRETRIVAIEDITEIHAKVNGILPTLFDYGTIEILYNWSVKPIRYTYAPRANDLVNKIHEIKTNRER